MKHKKLEIKTLLHFIVVALMLLLLLLGTVFSTYRISNDLKLGSQYRGSYQAIVGVYNVKDDNNNTLPKGDANRGADILQSKLSPFSDGSINVTIDGKSRLLVTAPRDAYEDNEQLFKDAIESTGGLFIFNDENKDIMLDKELMEKGGVKDSDGSAENRSATSELLGFVSQESKQVGPTNRPFLKFSLTNDYFQKIVIPGENDAGDAPKIRLVIDTDTVLKTLRGYFEYAPQKDGELDIFLQNYLDGVIKKIVKFISESQDKEKPYKEVLSDFFEISYWFQKDKDRDDWTKASGSLLDLGVNSLEKLKEILYADNTPEHKFTFTNPINKYTYDSNSTGKDFQENGKYSKPLTIKGIKVKVDEAFGILTSTLFDLLFDDQKNNDKVNNPFNINTSYFNPELFNDFFVFSGQVKTGGPNNMPEPHQAMIQNSDLFIGTKNYTKAKKAVSQISQTADGYSFHVFSVASVEAIISREMFIASLVILIIIILFIMVFLLFFYRLLGFFTMIVALAIGAGTLLMATIFGIAVGPEILAIMFVLISLVLDISVVFFESFKTSVYQEKRPLNVSFNISNRETLGLVVDVLIAAILPNIVLFWIGIGFLKNFATILTLGVLITFVFGIVVLRLLVLLVVNTGLFKKYPGLLPIDTSFAWEGSFLKNYLIRHYESSLEDLNKKSHLSAKQLLKIKKWEEKISQLLVANKKIVAKKQAKIQARQDRNLESWTQKQQKLIAKKDHLKLSRPHRWREKLLSSRISYYQMLITEDSLRATDKSNSVQLEKIQKGSSYFGALTLLVMGIFVILSLVSAFGFGFNYSQHYGKGTQFYIYGTYVTQTYDVLGNAESVEGLNPDYDEDDAATIATKTAIVKELKRIAAAAKDEVLSGGADASDKRFQNQWEALGVMNAYNYMISNDYMHYLQTTFTKNKFLQPVYQFGADYSMIDPSTGAFEDQPWVSITIKNDLIEQNNEIKTAFQKLANEFSGTAIPKEPTNEGGVLGMTLTPHTTVTQIKKIIITFCFVLLALIVYIVIRFKWTYYVALALSVIITIIATVAVVITFRIPFNIEALSGILGVLCFVLTTGVLFLGKGKSLIISRNEESLKRYFNNEIELESQKKLLKRNLKKELAQLVNNQKQELRALDKKDSHYKQMKKDLKFKHKGAYKEFKNEKIAALKEEFKKINNQIKIESQKNNFLKEIFFDVLKFALLRVSFLNILLLAVAIVLTLTLPPIFIMGFTLVVGVIITSLVMITILLPVWIRLESRRIRWKYGYKRFVNNLKVKREEQVIEGVNN